MKTNKQTLGAPEWRIATIVLCVFAAGCATQRIDVSRPVEHLIFVQAGELWQNSGVYARQGQLIQVEATGEWGDRDGTFDPEGNSNVYKAHLGVNAPAYALIMRLSTETNIAYFVGSEANITAKRSGHVMFRSNVSLPHRAVGQIQVALKVATDTDGDGVSDYDEVHIWGTDPSDPDTNGLGFGDLEKVTRMKEALDEKKNDESNKK